MRDRSSERDERAIRPAGAGRFCSPRLRAPLLAALFFAASCATDAPLGDRDYTRSEMTAATLLDRDDFRIYPDSGGTPSQLARYDGSELPPSDGAWDLLALSSGGPDGAFSAGILTAWNATGTMPDFEIVTGSSTGSLMAPFVFVGGRYMQIVSDLYLGPQATETLGSPSVAGLLSGRGLFSKTELRRQLDEYITPQLLADVAVRHAQGRRLYVVTGNYDAREFSAWNMGAIASVGTPQSLELFKQVIEAAVSVPGALAPVEIAANTPRGMISELHADAGPMAYMYADPGLFPPSAKGMNGRIPARIHILINRTYKPVPEPMGVKPRDVFDRTMSIFTHNGMQLRLRLVWDEANSRGMEIRYGYLRGDFDVVTAVDFNAAHLRKSFNEGMAAFSQNRLWRTARP